MPMTFDDIAPLDDRDVQQILTNIERSDLCTALKAASENVKEKVFSNMSERAEEIIREELEYMDSVSDADVEAVQQRIMDVVSRVKEAGPKSVLSEDYLSMKSELKDKLQRTPSSELSFAEIKDVMIHLTKIARSEGILALDEIAEVIHDELLQWGVQLAVDGTEPGSIRDLLETRMRTLLHQYETRYRMIIEGIGSIQQGAHPRLIDHRMRLFY